MSEVQWPLVLPERWAWAPRTGAFVSPDGILYIVDLHINAILRDPGLFGFTSDHVEAVFRKHDERLWTEGEARAELIEEAIQGGWIRIRDYGDSGISVNACSLDTRTRQILIQWARSVLASTVYNVDRYTLVHLRTPSESTTETLEVLSKTRLA